MVKLDIKVAYSHANKQHMDSLLVIFFSFINTFFCMTILFNQAIN